MNSLNHTRAFKTLKAFLLICLISAIPAYADRPETGTELHHQAPVGVGALTIENITGRDAVVLLTSTLRETCFLAVYVRAHESTKVEHIRANSNGYWLLYEQGTDYNSETGLFENLASFYRVPRVLLYSNAKDGGSHWAIQIGDNNSEKAISKDEFLINVPSSPKSIKVVPQAAQANASDSTIPYHLREKDPFLPAPVPPLTHSLGSTGIRHNRYCRWYNPALPCSILNGRPCTICGG